MIVIVSFKEHNRRYSVGIQTLLQSMGINVSDEKLIKAIKNLLEQEQMDVES